MQRDRRSSSSSRERRLSEDIVLLQRSESSIREVRYQHSPLGSSIRYISISSISSTQNTKEKGDRSG